MRIFQTFWTKPMSEDRFNCNVYIAVLSLAYAHQAGYKITMYTDSKGYEILKNFDYDEINTYLDEIPGDVSPWPFFAYPKFFAGLKEPIGSVHIDFDVFLKRRCLDEFFNDKSNDIILQCREVYAKTWPAYVEMRNIFSTITHPEELHIDHLYSSNVGTIGFNNQKLKDEYFNIYFKYVDFYKDKIHLLNNMLPELMSEQVQIDYILQNNDYKPLYLLPDDFGEMKSMIDEVADNIGYQHLQGGNKYGEYSRNKIESLLKYKFTDSYIKLLRLGLFI